MFNQQVTIVMAEIVLFNYTSLNSTKGIRTEENKCSLYIA